MKKPLRTLRYLKFYNVLKCAHELKALQRSKNSSTRQKCLQTAKDCLINAISEIAKNCLAGNIPLKNCDFQYKNLLKNLSKKSSIATRKKLIIQNGGLLNVLLPPAFALLSNVVANYIAKKYLK